MTLKTNIEQAASNSSRGHRKNSEKVEDRLNQYGVNTKDRVAQQRALHLEQEMTKAGGFVASPWHGPGTSGRAHGMERQSADL